MAAVRWRLAVFSLILCGCENAAQPQPQPQIFQPQPQVFQPETSQPQALRRQKISLSVLSLADLKVSEGDSVELGTLLSDRTEQRTALESQIDSIRSAIEQAEQAIAPMPPLPEPNFSEELAELDRAQAMAKYWEGLPMPEPRLRGEIAQLDYATINRQHELEAERLRAQLAVESAIARLEVARSTHEQAKYRYELQKADWRESAQRQEYQISQLKQQLATTQEKLDRLATVRSPVAGVVRRVRIGEQVDLQINVEIIIDVMEQ